MQKKLTAMTLALLMMLSITASALSVSPRWNATGSCDPTLIISGTTATCQAEVIGDSDAKISGTMTLYRVSGGNEYYVNSWSVSGTRRAYVSKTCTVKSGETYRLVINVTVSGSNGSDNITVSTSKTCK